MINPQMIQAHKPLYTCQEGCLCHEGLKETKRYEKIKVKYLDQDFRPKIKTFDKQTAQIIQHEIDHLNGILFTDHIDKKNPFKGKDEYRAI